MLSTDICVVLVEPKGAANIGSVARTMKNFGFADLRLIKPRADHLSPEATNMAVKAADLLHKAKLYNDLAAAVSDARFVMGTTRRFGKYREDFLPPRAAGKRICALAPHSRAALVFGREDKGLKTAELDLCQQFVTIPTHDALPSLNLAQAVAVCLYEVAVALGEVGMGAAKAEEDRVPAPNSDLEDMFVHMRQTLLAVEFLDHQNPDHLLRAFRRIFGRQGLDEREVRILHGLWSKMDWLNKERIKD